MPAQLLVFKKPTKVEAPKPKVKKRPITTYYYRNANDKDDAWVTQGHSRTELGAVKGCAWRVHMANASFDGVYGKAVIEDTQSGVVLRTLVFTSNGTREFIGRMPTTRNFK